MNELINNQSESEILKIVKDNQKNFEANKKIIEQILIKERGYLVKINKNDSVVLLVSGGLDSIITMAYIVEKFEVNVYPLFPMTMAVYQFFGKNKSYWTSIKKFNFTKLCCYVCYICKC